MQTSLRPHARFLWERTRWLALDSARLASSIVTRRPRFAVLSMWDDRQAALGNLTGPNKAAYCRRHGCDWLPFNDGFDPTRPVAWSKLLFIRRHLPRYDWILWSDADSAITNPSLPLEHLTSRHAGDLLITRDGIGINAGSFLIRNCPWSHRFLQEAWDYPSTPEYRRHYDIGTDRMWDNRSFLVLATHPLHRRHIHILPQRTLNSYPPEFSAPHPRSAHHPGDFIIHLPGIDDTTRLRILARYLAPAP